MMEKKTDPGRWQNSHQKATATKCGRNTGSKKSAKTKHNWHGWPKQSSHLEHNKKRDTQNTVNSQNGTTYEDLTSIILHDVHEYVNNDSTNSHEKSYIEQKDYIIECYTANVQSINNK